MIVPFKSVDEKLSCTREFSLRVLHSSSCGTIFFSKCRTTKFEFLFSFCSHFEPRTFSSASTRKKKLTSNEERLRKVLSINFGSLPSIFRYSVVMQLSRIASCNSRASP